MKTIPLTNGQEAIVDDDVYEWAKDHTWSCCNGYPTTTWKRMNQFGMVHRVPAALHRILTGFSTTLGSGRHVDHINRNKLDNRRENIRVVSIAENMKNSARRPRVRKPFWIKRQVNKYKESRYEFFIVYLEKDGRKVYGKSFRTRDKALRFAEKSCMICT